MKLSFVFELLLFFVLIAFAASAVIGKSHLRNSRRNVKAGNKRQESTANRYCSCSTNLCNCCREFNLPVVALRGPGCATLQYLNGNRLAISMSFGERVLTNTTVSSKTPNPICMPLPGGVSKFCGRIYNIDRKGENFNACLGLELRSGSRIEASMRVSCFRFGPEGLKLEPPQPLPVVENEYDEDDDDDDDDDDEDFDFDDDEDYDDEDDDEDEEEPENNIYSGNKRRKPTSTTTRVPLRRRYTRPSEVSKPVTKKVITQRPKPEKKVVKTPVTKSAASSTTKIPTTSSMMVEMTINDITLPQNQNITMTMLTDSTDNFINSTMTNTKSNFTDMSTMPSSEPVEMSSSTGMPLDIKSVTTMASEIAETSTQLSLVSEDIKSQEEDDPLAEAVEDVINDDDSDEGKKESEEDSDEDSEQSSEEETEKTTNDIKQESTTLKSKNDKKEAKDVFDDIADGVAETFGSDDDDDDIDEKDDDDDDDDDDELFRSLKPKTRKEIRESLDTNLH